MVQQYGTFFERLKNWPHKSAMTSSDLLAVNTTATHIMSSTLLERDQDNSLGMDPVS